MGAWYFSKNWEPPRAQSGPPEGASTIRPGEGDGEGGVESRVGGEGGRESGGVCVWGGLLI